MRRFLIIFSSTNENGEEEDFQSIYALVKDCFTNMYRFVDLSHDTIVAISFKTPVEALNFLDTLEDSWWTEIDY